MEGDPSLLIHSTVHLSIKWAKLWNLFFPAVNMCCNARKWWQWLVLKWDGFISAKMGTASWRTQLFLHPSRCICISDTSFQFFPYENLFSGENSTCNYRIHYEKYVCLIVGYLGFVPRCAKQKQQ